jgi:hypothetical protein
MQLSYLDLPDFLKKIVVQKLNETLSKLHVREEKDYN